jgi:excinuclease ABC subunit B
MMNRFRLVSGYQPAGDQGSAITALKAGLEKGQKYQTLKGVTGSGKTFTMANIIAETGLPTLVLSHNKTLAAQLYRELIDFFPDNAVEYFVSYYDYYQPEAYVPSKDLYIEKDSSINEEIDRMRLSATSSLMERRDVIVVATVSCIYGLGSPVDYRDMRVKLETGHPLNPGILAKDLIRLQYERNDSVLQRGSFRIRGDVIEIFPAYLQEALRLELDWDELVRLRRIHPLTGETIEELNQVQIYPAKHFVMPEDQVRSALEQVRRELDAQLESFEARGKLLEAQRLRSRTEYDLEMLQEMGYCSGIENYSGPLSGRTTGQRPAVLLDYFPEQFLTFIDESHVSLPQVGAMYEGDRSRKTNLVEYGFRLPSALDNRPLFIAEFEELLDKVIYVSATPGKIEHQRSATMVEQIIRPTGLLDPEVEVRPSEGQIEDLYAEIRRRVEKNERTLVTTLTKKMAEDLTDYLSGLGLKVRYLHSEVETIERVEILRDLRLGTFDVLIGINLLREGLDLPEVSLIAILDADKVGFLRSATSLIQTIGRAARNENGKVIMYADRYSDAMKSAIEETGRRRDIQKAWNREHGITPTTIRKAVQDLLVRKKEEAKEDEKQTIEMVKAGYNILIPGDRKKLIKHLEEMMLEHAKNLEFEQAAMVRDEVVALKDFGKKG